MALNLLIPFYLSPTGSQAFKSGGYLFILVGCVCVRASVRASVCVCVGGGESACEQESYKWQNTGRSPWNQLFSTQWHSSAAHDDHSGPGAKQSFKSGHSKGINCLMHFIANLLY